MNRLTCRRVVISGAAAAAGLAALDPVKHAHAQTQAKPTGVTPAELARHEKYMRLAIAQANKNPAGRSARSWSTSAPARWWAKAWRTWP